MNDLISRQAAIDTLNVGAELLRRVLDEADIVGVERAKYEWGLGLIESYISDMKELPSAQQWIPCSERLPEVNERCLCTYEFNEGTCVDFGLYTKRGWFVSGVTAWMPLPEPYKEERSE